MVKHKKGKIIQFPGNTSTENSGREISTEPALAEIVESPTGAALDSLIEAPDDRILYITNEEWGSCISHYDRKGRVRQWFSPDSNLLTQRALIKDMERAEGLKVTPGFITTIPEGVAVVLFREKDFLFYLTYLLNSNNSYGRSIEEIAPVYYERDGWTYIRLCRITTPEQIVWEYIRLDSAKGGASTIGAMLAYMNVLDKVIPIKKEEFDFPVLPTQLP